MLCSYRTALLIVATCLIAPSAQGAIIVPTVGDIPGGDPLGGLVELQMSVELTVADGVAMMTFTNTSAGQAAKSVINEIVLDTWDDDTGMAILTDPVLPEATKDVAFKLASSNGLPGYQAETTDGVPLIELRTATPKPVKGLSVGESLTVTFGTSLADGSDIGDFLAAFGGGEDTAAWSIGFHALRAGGTASSPSSGIVVPEPATLATLAGGVLLALLRRKRR